MTQEPLKSKLEGIVEVDETYIGGKAKNMHASKRKEKIEGRGAVGKAAVMTLVERDGRVKSQHLEHVTGQNLKAALREYVQKDARIMTDESPSYSGVDQEFASHETVNHKAGEYARKDVHVNTSESVHAILKRGVIGVYHHWSPQHLHRYLTEFDFRFNLRKINDAERMMRAVKSVEGKRLMYQSPVGLKKSS